MKHPILSLVAGQLVAYHYIAIAAKLPQPYNHFLLALSSIGLVSLVGIILFNKDNEKN